MKHNFRQKSTPKWWSIWRKTKNLLTQYHLNFTKNKLTMKPLSEIIEAQKSQTPKLGIQIIDRNSIDYLCKCTGFDYETLKQPSREQHYAFARNIIFDHLREIGFSFNEIGLIFNRSHATVMHGITKKNTFLALKDPLFLTYYNKFRKNYYQLVVEAFEIFMANDFNIQSDGE